LSIECDGGHAARILHDTRCAAGTPGALPAGVANDVDMYVLLLTCND